MWPTLLTLGGFKISIWLIFSLLALIWASFVTWLKMREDFTNEEIFTFTSWLIVGGGIFFIGGKVIGIAGLVAVLWWWCYKNKWDFWDLFDFLAIVGLWWWLGGNLAWGMEALWQSVFAAVGIIIAWWVRTNYRKFRWYTSGRVGLVGLTVLATFLTAQIVVAMFTPVKVYWWGLSLDQLAAAWVMAFTLVVIYLRSGRKFGT